MGLTVAAAENILGPDADTGSTSTAPRDWPSPSGANDQRPPPPRSRTPATMPKKHVPDGRAYWKSLHDKSRAELLMRATRLTVEHRTVALVTSHILLVLVVLGVVFVSLYVYVQTLNTRLMFRRYRRWFHDPTLALANVGIYAPIISNNRDDPKTFRKTNGKATLPVYTATFEMLTTNVWYPFNAHAQTLLRPGFFIGPTKARFLLWMLENFSGSMNRLSWIGSPNVDVRDFVSERIGDAITLWNINKGAAQQAFKDAWCCWNRPENYMRFLFPTPQAYLQSMHLYNVAAGTDPANTDIGLLLRTGVCGWVAEQDPTHSLGRLIQKIFISIGGTQPKMDCTAQKAMADLDGAMQGTMVGATTIGIGIVIAGAFPGPGLIFGGIIAAVGAIAGGIIGWLSGASGVKKARAECDQTDIDDEKKKAVNWCISQGLGAFTPSYDHDWGTPDSNNLQMINQDYCQANGDALAIFALAFNSVCQNNPICMV